MMQNTTRLKVVLLTFAILIFSCRGGGLIDTDGTDNANSPSEENNSQLALPPFPESIEIKLETGAVETTVIGPEGGTLSVVDANGIKYSLVVPEGALVFDQEITMMPIANVEGEMIGETFLAGVKLQPEGLHFLDLVSIEIIGDQLEEGTVGFASNNGQDLHLMPSSSGDGSRIITTTHFSEYGVSLEELAELGDLVSDIEIAVAENIMERGTREQRLAALDRWTQLLLNDGSNGITLQSWTPWTSSVMSLILYMNHAATIFEWNSNTPGFTEMIAKMQSLIDLWFEKSGEVAENIEEKCIDGEIDYWGRGITIIKTGEALVNQLTLEGREDLLESWSEKVSACQEVGITWQANIVAKAGDFESDISVGSQAETAEWGVGIIHEELEVEYIEGFWEDKCVPMSGKVNLSYKIEYEFENLGLQLTSVVQGITAWVKITEPVYIDCSPLGFTVDADAQSPFHGAAMDRLNEERMSGDDAYSEFWEFELKYDPGGGIIAQFEEGPKTLNVPELTYKLWQLLTLYQTTPAD